MMSCKLVLYSVDWPLHKRLYLRVVSSDFLKRTVNLIGISLRQIHGSIGDSSPDTIPLVILRVTYVKSFGCRLSHVGRGGEGRGRGKGEKKGEEGG